LLTGVIATALAVAVGTSAGFLGGLCRRRAVADLANVFLVLPALPLLVVMLGYLSHSGSAADHRSSSVSWAGRGAPG
jgi:peptide/nickel transport system permease protein